MWRWVVALRDGAQTYQQKFVFIFQLVLKLRPYIYIWNLNCENRIWKPTLSHGWKPPSFGYVYPIHIYGFLFFKILQLGKKKKTRVTNANKKSFFL